MSLLSNPAYPYQSGRVVVNISSLPSQAKKKTSASRFRQATCIIQSNRGKPHHFREMLNYPSTNVLIDKPNWTRTWKDTRMGAVKKGLDE
jgi:hypothetical protein